MTNTSKVTLDKRAQTREGQTKVANIDFVVGFSLLIYN